MKSQDTSELFFDDVKVPAENLLGGKEGQGFFQLMGDLPYERLFIGVSAVACMEGAYEATLKYVRERKAFGQTVADFQNTKFKLAEVATQIAVGRAFMDKCVEQIDPPSAPQSVPDLRSQEEFIAYARSWPKASRPA